MKPLLNWLKCFIICTTAPYQIELNRSETDGVHLPLGWYLSNEAKKKIGVEARGMLDKKENNQLENQLKELFLK